MIYCRDNIDGTLKSSVDKFYSEDELTNWAAAFEAEPGDLMLALAGQTDKVRKQLNELRLEMGTRLGLRDKNTFAPLWGAGFPPFIGMGRRIQVDTMPCTTLSPRQNLKIFHYLILFRVKYGPMLMTW